MRWIFLFFLFFGSLQANVYCSRLENWNLGCVKTPGIDDRKRVHISNIEPFAIVDSREFSRDPNFNLQAGRSIMQGFISSHVPMREDGKINIPHNIKHIKLDIGLSYSAPMSQNWLSNEDDLWVFGFEPDSSSVSSIKKGATKMSISHGEPLDLKYVGTSFFVIPCALGLESGATANFYKTKTDCGASSLYRPKYLEIEEMIKVPVFCLSDFFDLFPFDTHPVVDYIKIDAQGSDLDIVKSAGAYLRERVIYITLEPENYHYEDTINSEADIDEYMRSIGFEKFSSEYTNDPTYFNPRFVDYIRENRVKIFQKG